MSCNGYSSQFPRQGGCNSGACGVPVSVSAAPVSAQPAGCTVSAPRARQGCCHAPPTECQSCGCGYHTFDLAYGA